MYIGLGVDRVSAVGEMDMARGRLDQAFSICVPILYSSLEEVADLCVLPAVCWDDSSVLGYADCSRVANLCTPLVL